jgi:hypothetical protein
MQAWNQLSDPVVACWAEKQPRMTSSRTRLEPVKDLARSAITLKGPYSPVNRDFYSLTEQLQSAGGTCAFKKPETR